LRSCDAVSGSWAISAHPDDNARATLVRPRLFTNPNTRPPKTKLALPDLDHGKSAVPDSLGSRESKRGYRHAIDEFIQWHCSEPSLSFRKIVVTRYRIFLEDRRLAAGIRRVNGVKKPGVRLGNWLTVDDARRLLQSRESDAL
jgi:hypothetical protein